MLEPAICGPTTPGPRVLGAADVDLPQRLATQASHVRTNPSNHLALAHARFQLLLEQPHDGAVELAHLPVDEHFVLRLHRGGALQDSLGVGELETALDQRDDALRLHGVGSQRLTCDAILLHQLGDAVRPALQARAAGIRWVVLVAIGTGLDAGLLDVAGVHGADEVDRLSFDWHECLALGHPYAQRVAPAHPIAQEQRRDVPLPHHLPQSLQALARQALLVPGQLHQLLVFSHVPAPLVAPDRTRHHAAPPTRGQRISQRIPFLRRSASKSSRTRGSSSSYSINVPPCCKLTIPFHSRSVRSPCTPSGSSSPYTATCRAGPAPLLKCWWNQPLGGL